MSVGKGVIVSVKVGIGVDVSVGGGAVHVAVGGITVKAGLAVAGGGAEAVGCGPLPGVHELDISSNTRTGIPGLKLIL